MRTHRNSRRGIVLVIALAFASGVSPNTADDAAVVARLAGGWEFAGTEQERQARTDAIEATVSQMAWIARGIARKRMTASTPIHDRYDFQLDGGSVTISEDQIVGHTAPWDGTPVEIPRKQGGPATLTRSVEDGALHSHWQQKKGAGTEIYRPSDDGETLIVTVIVSSPRLPSDVRYELTYHRADPAVSSRPSDGL